MQDDGMLIIWKTMFENVCLKGYSSGLYACSGLSYDAHLCCTFLINPTPKTSIYIESDNSGNFRRCSATIIAVATSSHSVALVALANKIAALRKRFVFAIEYALHSDSRFEFLQSMNSRGMCVLFVHTTPDITIVREDLLLKNHF
jgi:hypothetical protein